MSLATGWRRWGKGFLSWEVVSGRGGWEPLLFLLKSLAVSTQTPEQILLCMRGRPATSKCCSEALALSRCQLSDPVSRR